MDKTVETTPSLTMKRRLNASPAEVFQAWTDPELLVRWFGPENVTTMEAHVDPRVGGGFRVVMLENTGDRHEVSGTYYEVVENERLMFSWSWITTPDRVSSVTVTFKPDGDGTILTLRHEKLFDEQAIKGHTHGWTGSLVKLEAILPDGPAAVIARNAMTKQSRGRRNRRAGLLRCAGNNGSGQRTFHPGPAPCVPR